MSFSNSSPFPSDDETVDHTVEKINEEYREYQEEQQTPPPPQTMGNSSMDKIKKLSRQLGVDRLGEDVDRVSQDIIQMKSSIDQLSQSQQQMIDAMNGLITQINGGGGASSPQQPPANGISNMTPENIQSLVSVIDGLVDTWKKVKGNDAPAAPQPLISQQIINDKMQQAFFDNLETGESINNFVKNALKKRTTQTIMNTALNDIGKGDTIHEPE